MKLSNQTRSKISASIKKVHATGRKMDGSKALYSKSSPVLSSLDGIGSQTQVIEAAEAVEAKGMLKKVGKVGKAIGRGLKKGLDKYDRMIGVGEKEKMRKDKNYKPKSPYGNVNFNRLGGLSKGYKASTASSRTAASATASGKVEASVIGGNPKDRAKRVKILKMMRKKTRNSPVKAMWQKSYLKDKKKRQKEARMALV